jgi:hypothetical protein
MRRAARPPDGKQPLSEIGVLRMRVAITCNNLTCHFIWKKRFVWVPILLVNYALHIKGWNEILLERISSMAFQ